MTFLIVLAAAVAWIVFGYLLCIAAELADPAPTPTDPKHEWSAGMVLFMVVLWPIPLVMACVFTIQRLNKRSSALRYILGWPVRFLIRLDHRHDA